MIGQLFGPRGLIDCYLCAKPVTIDPRRLLKLDIGQPSPAALCNRCLVEHAGLLPGTVAILAKEAA